MVIDVEGSCGPVGDRGEKRDFGVGGIYDDEGEARSRIPGIGVGEDDDVSRVNVERGVGLGDGSVNPCFVKGWFVAVIPSRDLSEVRDLGLVLGVPRVGELVCWFLWLGHFVSLRSVGFGVLTPAGSMADNGQRFKRFLVERQKNPNEFARKIPAEKVRFFFVREILAEICSIFAFLG